MTAEALQEQFWPEGTCYGCGPANDQGLRVRSVVQGDEVVAEWTPQPHHAAFPGVLSGGIIGTLLDCHSNWTAAWTLMRAAGAERPPCTVTADYHVRLLRPTPTDGAVTLRAHAVETQPDRAVIEATLAAAGVVTATCRGTFVAVRPGHPAFHRW